MKKIAFIGVIFAATLMVLSACTVNSGGVNSVRGTGDMVLYDITETGFTGLNISGGYELTFRQSPDFSVTLEIQSNLFNYIETSVRGGVFYLSSTRGFTTSSGNTPQLVVYTPDLDSLHFAGSVDADIYLHVNQLDVNLAGAGDVTLAGSAQTLNIETAGASDISAFDLIATNATISIAGAGNAEVYATDTLDVSIAGVGNVRYDGDAVVTRSVAGVGSVQRRN